MSTDIFRRLFEAYTHNRGLKISADEVDVLLADEAISTRITNEACKCAGIEEWGEDGVRDIRNETWKQFQERLSK